MITDLLQRLLQHPRFLDYLADIFMAILFMAITPFVYSNTVKRFKITSPALKLGIAIIWGIIVIGILFLLYLPVPK